MEFALFKTPKGEEVCVNLARLLYYTESKKGVQITMEDGMVFDIALTVQEFNFRLNRRDIAVVDTTKK